MLIDTMPELALYAAGGIVLALTAESKLKQFDLTLTSKTPTPERLAALERLNKDLKARLEDATERTSRMVERVKFLREQQQASAGVR